MLAHGLKVIEHALQGGIRWCREEAVRRPPQIEYGDRGRRLDGRGGRGWLRDGGGCRACQAYHPEGANPDE